MPRQYTPKAERVCVQCGKTFLAHPSVVKAGYARFCSKPCQYAARAVPVADHMRERISAPTDNGCILWTGRVNNRGYGVIPDKRNRKMLLAHRVAWELVNGPIPDDMEVCHNCPGGDNPSCVNHAHMFLGTHADNMRDAGRKGQMARGERHRHRKLTDVLVREIRHLYAAGGTTQQALADRFGVSISQICGVINRTAWGHVT